MKTALTRLLDPLKQATAFIAGLSVATASFISLSSPTQAAPRSLDGIKMAAVRASTLPNGTYLYGQTAKPDQIGKAYFVFEVRQGKVLGALYMPRSSFDCTYGSFQSDKVALTVVDSYDRTENPYAIAVERISSVASRNNSGLGPVGLEGFQRLGKLSQNDQRILSMCKANYQQRAWN
jgi:hypothetical protein